MEIVDKQVHEVKNGVTVEFVGEGGDVVSVHMKKDENGHLNRLNAEEKAKAVMVQIATFDTDVAQTGEHSSESGADDHSELDSSESASPIENDKPFPRSRVTEKCPRRTGYWHAGGASRRRSGVIVPGQRSGICDG